MEKKINRVLARRKIATTAKVWRRHDEVAIADKRDPDKQRAEYRARQHLRKVIDDAGGHS